MSTNVYTVLGWLVWKIGLRVAKRKVQQNRIKVGAVAVVAGVVVAGAIVAKAGGRSDGE